MKNEKFVKLSKQIEELREEISPKKKAEEAKEKQLEDGCFLFVLIILNYFCKKCFLQLL